MIDFENIFSALSEFLSHPDKGWSLASFQFFVSFIVFYIIYIALAGNKSNRAKGKYNHIRYSFTVIYVIAFSLFFAWKANGILMLLLPATALFSWWATRRMMHAERFRKLWLTVIILVNLAPLVYYKYTNFLITIFNDLLHSNFAPLDLILPIGISFYTFQAISYSIDVYKWKFTSETPLLDYLFYLTFFPLLMAGPITRAEVLIPQLSTLNPQPSTTNSQPQNINPQLSTFNSHRPAPSLGLWLIIIGLIKKAVIADYIAQYNNWVFDDPTAYSGLENLMAVLGFTLQIFCDFSGYSDIAIGLAALMGFELRDNFNFPYQSLNPTEFWHRWHIALSTWFRDYLYIPLGGNRHGLFRTCLNGFFTMVVAGLWHGASWMFIIWGALHGIALAAHKICKRLFLDRIPNTIAVRVICWILMFSFICTTWIFFRADSIGTAITIISRSVSEIHLSDFFSFVITRPLWVLLVALGLELHSIRRDDYDWLESRFISLPWYVKFIAFAITIQLVINFSQESVQPFIYTQF